MKYHKVGKGKILNCWFDKIKNDFTLREKESVVCECGNLIGTISAKGIRMKPNSITYSGTIIKK
ncbi:MAG: hypothetical protein KKA84_06930 [Bacteroidetes bacterium]|nr:hypothetical protein [Bacteroidota bacterium]